jgi:endoglucanase
MKFRDRVAVLPCSAPQGNLPQDNAMLPQLWIMGCFTIAILISSVNYASSATLTNGLIESKVMLGDAWNTYIDHFIKADGRVVDDGNGGISHSEGQGYAMLIAVRLNDREMFHKIWRWTTDNLFVRQDGLPAWVWDPKAIPHNRDIDDATDGNLLIAWALAEAGTLWNRAHYSTAARRLANIAGELDTAPSHFGPLLLPGSTAFGASDRSDGPVVNASYWVFPAFSHLKQISPNVDWVGLALNGLDMAP